eukprot:7037864-Ditylum_brightwellii.AAC.1
MTVARVLFEDDIGTDGEYRCGGDFVSMVERGWYGGDKRDMVDKRAVEGNGDGGHAAPAAALI